MSAPAQWRVRLRAQRPVLRDIAIAVLLAMPLLALGLIGWRSGARSAAAAAELQSVLDATAALHGRIVPPAAPESAAWRASADALRELGFRSTERLALLERVARRARAAGIADARMHFVDAASSAAARSAPGWTARTADYALAVTFDSDYRAAVAFAAALPPMLEVRSLSLTRGAPGEMTLAVYETTPDQAAVRTAAALSAREWRALASYARPVEAVTRVVDTGETPPAARDPFSRPAPLRVAAARPPQDVQPTWTVSAIMITPRRRIAVVDERVVAPGDTIAGGARIAAIEANHVVIQERSGRMLQLSVNARSEQ